MSMDTRVGGLAKNPCEPSISGQNLGLKIHATEINRGAVGRMAWRS